MFSYRRTYIIASEQKMNLLYCYFNAQVEPKVLDFDFVEIFDTAIGYFTVTNKGTSVVTANLIVRQLPVVPGHTDFCRSKYSCCFVKRLDTSNGFNGTTKSKFHSPRQQSVSKLASKLL